MGLSLGSVLGSVFTGGLSAAQVDIAGSALGVSNPRTTAVVAGISSLFGPEAGGLASAFAGSFDGPDDQGGPVIYDDSGNVYGGSTGNGGTMPVALPAMAGLTSLVAQAILRLSQTLGGARGNTMGAVVAYGKRVYDQLAGWAVKNPGVSLISMLVSLGLTAEQAAHFLAWGATKKRRRRAKGISAAQLRTTRRTMRAITRMYHSLPLRSSRGSRFSKGSGATIVQAR